MSRQGLNPITTEEDQGSNELLRYDRPLILERPDLQTLSQRWGYRSVTVFAWLAWLYLFVPLLSVAAWVAGLTLVYELLLQGLDVDELWALLRVYSIGIGTFCGIYLCWAGVSFIRFRGVERRKAAPTASTEALAASHSLPAAEIESWRKKTNYTVPAETLELMFAVQRGEQDEPGSEAQQDSGNLS